MFKTHSSSDPLLKYIENNSLRLTPEQKELIQATMDHPKCVMMGDAVEMQLLQNLVRLTGAKKTLDIGVYTGYSALSVALALPDGGKVVACDVNDDFVRVGKPFWKKAGVEQKIDLRIAPARETLDELLSNGESGTFDFAFIDADGENYQYYYECCLKLVRQGGVIVLDNTLLSGKVADDSVADESVSRRRRLNEFLHKDERIDISFLPVGDGTTICRIR